LLDGSTVGVGLRSASRNRQKAKGQEKDAHVTTRLREQDA
jgi:hypothetical protein